MSLVHLSSIGQQPNRFTNMFPNGIQLGAGAEVTLVGYSGNLNEGINADDPTVYEIVINKGRNDAMVYYHANLGAAATEADLYYQPRVVTIEAGVYTPDLLADELTLRLNESEQISQYKNNWEVTYDAVNFKFLIKCGKKRAVNNAGGLFVNYSSGDTTGVVNGAGSSTLTPHTNTSFIDTTPLFIGNTSQAIGLAGANVPDGLAMQFTTVGATTLEDVGFSLCMVSKTNATKMKFKNETSLYPENNNLEYTGQCDPDIDFADGRQGPETFGFCPHGLTINPADGRIGIIGAKTRYLVGGGDVKDPQNWVIRWTGTNINLAAAGVKKFGMSCRYDAASGFPVIEYLCDVTGAGWVSLGTVDIDGTDGDTATYRFSQNYYGGVVVSPTTAQRATAPAIAVARSNSTGGASADPDEPIELCFAPYDYHLEETDLVVVSGLSQASRKANNLGKTLGFPMQNISSATSFTVGFTSAEEVTHSGNKIEYSPLLITCPDLPIQGYVGGANGTTAPLLGVGRINGTRFSDDPNPNWIQLRNTKPISLYRLRIDLKTVTMADYKGLEPNFNLWLKFRSNTNCLKLKENEMMGVMKAV